MHYIKRSFPPFERSVMPIVRDDNITNIALCEQISPYKIITIVKK